MFFDMCNKRYSLAVLYISLLIYVNCMQTHRALIAHMKHVGVLCTPHIARAFEKIDRRDFVSDIYADKEIYADKPLSIGYGQTISQPSTVAFMMELLQPQQGEKILDVGSGSGWTTALLSEIVGNNGRVYGVEIVSELVRLGSENIAKYLFIQTTILHGHDAYGLSEHAPYDKILVSAAGNGIPNELREQLVEGGILVIPVENTIVHYIKNTENGGSMQQYFGFNFVPLIDPSQRSVDHVF